MRRPNRWVPALLAVLAVLAVGQFIALKWLAPYYVIRALERFSGRRFAVGGARLTFPLTTTVLGLHASERAPLAAFSVQQLTITPLWLSLPQRTLRLTTVEIVSPLVRFGRADDGTLVWPDAIELSVPRGDPAAPTAPPGRWRVHVTSLAVTGGVVEFIDEKARPPFHASLEHLSVVLGPLTLASHGAGWSIVPAAGAGTSFAVKGKLTGAGGVSALAYCSGWIDLAAKDLQASCRLEPLALSAFDPYYHGAAELRVYTATLQSTSQWLSRANDLTARIQLELNNLSEGDFSVRGRTIVDVNRLPGGPTPRLTGEVNISGPLDGPSHWRAEFLPGDEGVQDLVKRLLEHGVTSIKFPLGGMPMRVSVSPSTEATMTDIEAASKEVQEALEILALPPIPEAGLAASAAPPQPEPVPILPGASPIPSAGAEPVAPAAMPAAGAAAVPPSVAGPVPALQASPAAPPASTPSTN